MSISTKTRPALDSERLAGRFGEAGNPEHPHPACGRIALWTRGGMVRLCLLAAAALLLNFGTYSHVGLIQAARASGAATVHEVLPGEELEGIARQHLDDPDAGIEILNFNQLSPDSPLAPGTKLMIPSASDRKFAVSAIENVRGALEQLRHAGLPAGQEEAGAQLDGLMNQAAQVLQSGRYQKVIDLCDSAMALANVLMEQLGKRTVFDVEIRSGADPSQDTSVFSVHKGKVKVETPTSSTVLDEGKAGRVETASGRILVQELPEPPSLEAPTEGRVVYTHSIAFEWKPVSKGDEFKLEIARDVRFTQTELEAIVKGTKTVVTKDLPDGRHYWRISTVTGDGMAGKWSNHREFIMMFDSEPPELELGKPIWK